jgi:pilus assembly protein CpaB
VELTGNKYARGDWRKVLATRRGTILVATICALVAAAILIFAMQRYRHNVVAENNPATVLVASGTIPKGTTGDAIAAQQLFKPASVAGKQMRAGAIADTSQLHGKVTTADILPGEQLTTADFTGSGGLPEQLAPGERAMTIAVDPARGMIGQVHTGDHVDVYADIEAQHAPAFVRLIMVNVPVLKAAEAGSSSGLTSTSNQQNQQANVTLKVGDREAASLAFASDNGKVWLVLRPANAAATPLSTASVGSILSQNVQGAGR